MSYYEAHLEVKPSGIPNAGMGLFTNADIKKGEKIIEYKGLITTWEGADHQDGDNEFVFYVNEDHVIDASKDDTSLGRYANDAKGLRRIKGFKNNSEFMEDGLRVFIVANKNIKAGEEIFTDYGPDYWKTVKENLIIDQHNAKLI